jgi:hypothetical protein
MNFEQNKFGHPFNAGNQYFNQLSVRIQQRAGIQVIKVNDIVEPIIEFTKKQKQTPVQLTVEFGFPLTAEKIEKEDKKIQDITEGFENLIPTHNSDNQADVHVSNSDIGEIHIEPLILQPNSTPYWHEFNADDELEGLVLDSEGQEMSDITINSDGQLDLDHQIFHEIIPQEETQSLISDENIIENTSLANVDESLAIVEDVNQSLVITDEINQDIVSLDNPIVDFVNPEISTKQEIEDHSSPEYNEVNPNVVSDDINDELVSTNAVIDNSTSLSNEELQSIDESLMSDELPMFSFSFVPEIDSESNNETTLPLENVSDYTSNNFADEVPVVSEPKIEENQVVVETMLSFSSNDLDAIHEEFEAKQSSIIREKTIEKVSNREYKADLALEFSDADLDMLHDAMAKESDVAFEKSSAGKTVHIPVFEDVTGENAEVRKATIWDMIPWSSVFGVVASLMAIASAWFIWNSIQKPIAIDEFIDKAIVITPVSQTAVPVVNSTEENLSPSDYIASNVLDLAENTEREKTFRFSDLSERSKVSAVELEKLGLISLNLEDNFFEEPIF